MKRWLWVPLVFALSAAPLGRPAFALDISFTPINPSIFVQGKEIRFDHLASASGQPVVAASDTGLRSVLDAIGARMTWQAGTRFFAVTRADGTIVTLTVASNAMSVGGTTTALSLAPFYRGSDLYVPLLPLANALGLAGRPYRGGYIFVPRIQSVSRKIGQARTIVQISAAVPIAWRSAFDARLRVLTISFPGFGADASIVPLGGREASQAVVNQSGPPGFPTAGVSIDVERGVKFAAHREPSGVVLDIVLARDASALRLFEHSTPQPVGVLAPTSPAPLIPVPTAQPVTPSPSPLPGSAPAAPTGSEQPMTSPSPILPAGWSPRPAAATQSVKITGAVATDLATATRVTLTATGPVSFEWHRLDQPDNRYWIDIHNATLVGPAQTLPSKLAFVTEIKISQHAISPEPIVRVSVTPTQPIDVQVGPIEGSPNQMGVEIESSPPSSDAPRAGVGSIALSPQSPPPTGVVPTNGNLIVIDPGHGGNDPGAISDAYGLVEKQLTLELSRAVQQRLLRLGWQVTLTRDGDNEVGDPNGDDRQELQARCDVANAAGARVFLSIHMNSWIRPTLSGATTYFWRRDDRAFAQAVESAIVAGTGLGNDGVQRDDLYVVKHTNMPAVLVEAAYINNPHDAALLQQPSFIGKLADSIVKGIMAYTGGPQG